MRVEDGCSEEFGVAEGVHHSCSSLSQLFINMLGYNRGALHGLSM